MEEPPGVTDTGGGQAVPSYAQKVINNVNINYKKKYKSLDRNVIVIKVKKSENATSRYFDGELCGQLCELLGINS